MQIAKLKFSDELANGPAKNRKCTDIPMCLIFICFVLGTGVTAGYGFYLGNPWNLAIGWDSMGNGCGYSEATKDYPLLYFPQPPTVDAVADLKSMDFTKILDTFNQGVCVKACPTKLLQDPVDCLPTDKMKNNFKFKNC